MLAGSHPQLPVQLPLPSGCLVDVRLYNSADTVHAMHSVHCCQPRRQCMPNTFNSSHAAAAFTAIGHLCTSTIFSKNNPALAVRMFWRAAD